MSSPRNTSTTTRIADHVYRYLVQRRRIGHPSRSALRQLIDIAWLASLKTEEGRPTVCNLTYINPRNPDPYPPLSIRLPRWSYFPLKDPIPLSVRTLAKLAPALNPYTANIAVYDSPDNGLFVSGFTDQQTLFRQAFEYEDDGWWARPGLFQVDILGVGSLAVYDSDTLIISVRHDEVTTNTVDVFSSDVIAEKLAEVFEFPKSDEWDYFNVAIQCLCRVLIRMRRFRHGGALLFDESPPKKLLRLKYSLKYSKLDAAIKQYVRSRDDRDARDWRDICRPFAERYHALLDDNIADINIGDAQEAILGAVGLIASMTRVDGLVLIGKRFCVRGFGGEIHARSDPPRLVLSRTSRIPKRPSKAIEPAAYGTRHRSMLRYCWARPRSVGIVISQDGDVRVLTRDSDRVVVWENVRVDRGESATHAH